MTITLVLGFVILRLRKSKVRNNVRSIFFTTLSVVWSIVNMKGQTKE